jgi:hypothetical protein
VIPALDHGRHKEKEFAGLAPGNRVFRRRRHPGHWNRHVGAAGTCHHFYPTWSGHFGNRISMGQEMAFISPAMDPPSFQKIRPKEGTNRIMSAVKAKRKISAETIVWERRLILEPTFAPRSVAGIGASETPRRYLHVSTA